ncbi:unnamed protein product, partial [Sphacelaria rigidula]
MATSAGDGLAAAAIRILTVTSTSSAADATRASASFANAEGVSDGGQGTPQSKKATVISD